MRTSTLIRCAAHQIISARASPRRWANQIRNQGPPRSYQSEALKTAEPAWEAFPATLPQEIDSYFAGLAKVHRTLTGKRIQPCSATTIATRRAELAAIARMAVQLGVPIESLSSLAALLHPDVVEKVIDAYWAKNGDEPKTFTIDLGKKALRMARETGCLDQAALDRLDDIRVALEHHRREGLTPKNLQLIRQVLTDGVWNEVVSLPNVLMQQARSAKDHAPIKAAVWRSLLLPSRSSPSRPFGLPISSASSWARTSSSPVG